MFTLTLFLCRSTHFFCPSVVPNFYNNPQCLKVRIIEVHFIGRTWSQVDADINALFDGIIYKLALPHFFKDVPHF